MATFSLYGDKSKFFLDSRGVAEARGGSYYDFKILKLGSEILLMTGRIMIHDTKIIVSLHKS